MTPLLVLLTLHFIGDFLLQTDWMALRKSKSRAALTLHVVSYLLPFYLMAIWYVVTTGALESVVLFIAVTGAAHWVTDFTTSRMTAALWFIDLYPRPDSDRQPDDVFRTYGAYPLYARVEQEKRHWFFVTIGFDQLLHALQLGLTYAWLTA